MKKLNIKWAPETVAIIALTIAAPQDLPRGRRHIYSEVSADFATAAGTKLIVISGEKTLKAHVRMAA